MHRFLSVRLCVTGPNIRLEKNSYLKMHSQASLYMTYFHVNCQNKGSEQRQVGSHQRQVASFFKASDIPWLLDYQNACWVKKILTFVISPHDSYILL